MDREIWEKLSIDNVTLLISNKGNIAKICHVFMSCNSFRSDNSYPCVRIYSSGKQRKHFVHRLVAKAFIPNPDNLPQVNHINGVKTDNRVENLEWVTQSENIKHAFKNGLNHSGENHPKAKLTNAQRQEIVENYIPFSNEFGSRALGRKYGVDHKSILAIIKKQDID